MPESHLSHVTPSPTPTHLPQYMSALAAHTPNSIGAPIALAFIAAVIIALCYAAGYAGAAGTSHHRQPITKEGIVMNPLAVPAQQMHVLAPVLLAHHPKPLSASASHLAHGLAQAGGQMFKGMSVMGVIAVVAVFYLIFWGLSSALKRKFGGN